MIQRIADALLVRVYYPVSALIALDDRDCVMDVRMFDTMAGTEEICCAPGAKTLLLISHHPEGYEEAYEEDRRNFCCVSRHAGGAAMRFYIASEYFPCRQIVLFERASDMI